MTNRQSENANVIITQLLESMIDSQTNNTTALTSLKSELGTLQDQVGETNRILSEVNKHFTNGFRSDIKEHISAVYEQCQLEIAKSREEVEQTGQKVSDLADNLDKHYNAITRPGFWIKAIIGLVASIAVLVAGVIAIASWVDRNKSQDTEKQAIIEIRDWIKHHDQMNSENRVFPDSQPAN